MLTFILFLVNEHNYCRGGKDCPSVSLNCFSFQIGGSGKDKKEKLKGQEDVILRKSNKIACGQLTILTQASKDEQLEAY